jgi:hypothetical protein
MEVSTALRCTSFDLFRVSLDEPTASLFDGGESGAEASPCDPMATVAAAGEDAADPPVGHLGLLLGVGLRVVYVRELHGRTVLAPADTVIAVINEDLLDCAVADVGLLGVAVWAAVWPLPTPSGWNPMHQQPPETPLLASTSRAKSSQLSGESGRAT